MLTTVIAAGLLLLGVASRPALVIASWADVLHVRQLAVGSAAIVVVVEALVILYVRARVMSERRERAAVLAQPLAATPDRAEAW